jgi:CrcB protein
VRTTLAAIGIGGAIGSLGRLGIETLQPPWNGVGWPWATLAINVLGCLAIGALATLPRLRQGPTWIRPFLITGLLGGFTTYSALALEAGILLDSGHPGSAVGYLAATMVGGLAAATLGRWLVERDLPSEARA